MSTPFQNRIVGTVIVAAVAIIFLPDLLDGEKETYQSEFENIPQSPKFEQTREIQTFPEDELEKLPKTVLVEDEVVLDDEQQNSATNVEKDTQTGNVKVSTIEKPVTFNKETKSAPKPKALPEKSIPSQAWAIQLGSFRHKKNVDDLVKKLKGAGYTSFTRPIKTKNGTLTKVFVGPELSRSSLDKKLPALKKLTGMAGKVARFYPTK